MGGMATRGPADVVVVGGGVVGLSVAWTAASDGMAVTLIDPNPGRGASWAAAGMLAPVGEHHFGEDTLTDLNVRASREWPGFARRLEEASGLSIDYLSDGTLMVAVDPSDRVSIDDTLGFHLERGLTARRLSARECRLQEPLLSPRISSGAELADDHQVDNRHMVDALVAACRALRVSFIDDQASGVEIRQGRVTGVTLARGGRCTADAVVVAAGCHSGQLGGLPEAIRPPVRPVKGVTLRLRGAVSGPTIRRTLRGLVHGRHCYLVPRRDGTVVVGTTVEEKGFDLTVQVGAVGDLLDDARQLIPALEEHELIETTAGLRPGSPDNAPIVGSTGIEGLIVATGHYRNGILLAPVTAYEVTRLLRAWKEGRAEDDRSPARCGGRHETDLAAAFAPFGPGRFAPSVDADRGQWPAEQPRSVPE